MARSGLKKAALKARWISGLANPMDSICAITLSLWEPMARAEGSPNETSGAPVPAGEGVAGASAVAPAPAIGAGAAGAAGVDAVAGAGVEGTLEDAAAEADGVALG